MDNTSTIHSVYIVQCNDGTFYTGYSNNVVRRVKAHNAGRGAKYTRTRTPVKLVYQRDFSSKPQAMKEEYRIKQLNRENKYKLINTKYL